MSLGVLEPRESVVAAPHADLARTEPYHREKGLSYPVPTETASVKHAGSDQEGGRRGEC